MVAIKLFTGVGAKPQLKRKDRKIFFDVERAPLLKTNPRGWEVRRRRLTIVYKMDLKIIDDYPPFPNLLPGEKVQFFIRVTFIDSWASYQANRDKRISQVVFGFLNSKTQSEPSRSFGEFVDVIFIQEQEISFGRTVKPRKRRVIPPKPFRKQIRMAAAPQINMKRKGF